MLCSCLQHKSIESSQAFFIEKISDMLSPTEENESLDEPTLSSFANGTDSTQPLSALDWRQVAASAPPAPTPIVPHQHHHHAHYTHTSLHTVWRVDYGHVAAEWDG